MSSNSNSTANYGTTISIESLKVIAESMGIPNLSDECGKELSDDITFKLKHIIQDSIKFMNHSKRTKALPGDIDNALILNNIEPLYGFSSAEHIPFRFASGGGRELHYTEDKEMDLADVISNTSVKFPLDVSVRSHWLVIDGVQPTIPENPPPVSKDEQQLECVNPVAKLKKKENEKELRGKPSTGKMHKLRNVETVHVKQLATHELSVEQQLYYKEITEACVGSDETRRTEALQSLANDPGLHAMLPRMCTFIAEGVKVNVVQHNLALLIYLMRMVKSLFDNPTLYLEKYLHELIPSVLTCVLSKQLCLRPEIDNHWALRDFASRIIAQISKTFNTSVNNIQCRITRLFTDAISNEQSYLSTVYGAIQGLAELGPQLVKLYINPSVKKLISRMDANLEKPTTSNADRIAVTHIKSLLVKVLVPVLKTDISAPDLDEYRQKYGSLAQSLYNSVCKARITSASSGTVSPYGRQSLNASPGTHLPFVLTQTTSFMRKRESALPPLISMREIRATYRKDQLFIFRLDTVVSNSHDLYAAGGTLYMRVFEVPSQD